MSDPISIFISAGEASGEHYGALLMDALQPPTRRHGPVRPASSAWAARVWNGAGLDRIVPR